MPRPKPASFTVAGRVVSMPDTCRSYSACQASCTNGTSRIMLVCTACRGMGGMSGHTSITQTLSSAHTHTHTHPRTRCTTLPCRCWHQGKVVQLQQLLARAEGDVQRGEVRCAELEEQVVALQSELDGARRQTDYMRATADAHQKEAAAVSRAPHHQAVVGHC